MTDPTDERPFSYVKHLREIRDRIGKELEHMTAEEAYRWHQSREYKNPKLRRLMSSARPPKPPRSKYGTARALGLMPYPKYRPSGVEWLGEVPEHWEEAALQRVTASIRASNVDKHVRGRETPVKLCNYVDVYHNDRIDSQIDFVPSTATERQIKHFQLHVDDVLITKDSEVATDIGVPSLVVERVPDLVAGYHLTLIRPNVQRLVGPYLFRALQSDVASLQFTHGAQGVTRYGLTYASIKSVRLPVPPLSEQRAIAKYLDRETTKIDILIGKKEVLVKGLAEYRTALISRTVTQGLPPNEARKAGFDPHPKLKPSGVEWLGEVPEHWEVRSLGRVGYFFKGTGGTRSDKSATGVPCIRYGDIYTMYNHHVRTSLGFVSENKSRGYTPISYGDVLFAGSGETLGEIGKSVTNLLRKHTCCGGDVIIFRPTAGTLDPVFSGYALDCAHASWQKSCMGRGVTVMHIYASELKHLSISFPPRKEQEAIGSFLDRETTKIDGATDLARQEIDLLREYRTRLISDVVTGKVDVRGIGSADEETAA